MVKHPQGEQSLFAIKQLFPFIQFVYLSDLCENERKRTFIYKTLQTLFALEKTFFDSYMIILLNK